MHQDAVSERCRVRSGVDAVKLTNYPSRCGAGSSGRGRNPDDMSLAALPVPRFLIAGRVLHSALTLAQKSERFTGGLGLGWLGRGMRTPDEHNEF
jgi:hypothetical protein